MEQEQIGLWQMISTSGPVVRAVFFGLVITSFCSWAIAVAKFLQLRKATAQSIQFAQIFWDSRNFNRVEESARELYASPLSQIFLAGFKELSALVRDGKEGKIKRDHVQELGILNQSLKRAEMDEAARLESGITFLATVASAAPFVGLFGTVWGIMNAFHGLSFAKQSTLQAVAPGISEALVATAIGLAAAIPAAIAYNYFAVSVRRFRERMNKFSAEFVTLSRKYLAE